MSDQERSQSPRRRISDPEIALLSQRVDFISDALKLQSQQMTQLNTGIGKIENTLSTALVELRARSDSNRERIEGLDKRIEHEKGSSIARDTQQVSMIDAEENKREKADKDVLESMVKMLEAHIASDKERLTGIESILRTLRSELEKRTEDLPTIRRALIWIASIATAVIIAVLVTVVIAVFRLVFH